MGIHGLLQQIGHGQRISLAKLSSEHFTTHSRPFRLAIDISIWLFQIQSGKGGSNPALRTFYYRLLRLMSLNIHPLFVFDGPNKPLFKRNKKVGGPGVRVASVPEFLAKQLLKQFGFPWHVAPGEAEAECALLQREGIVDAVLSEDVDTLMFGSGVTLRNWTAENSTKSPTHVDVHRAEETKEKSGMDREGMILVALMSGGDYIPEGIPGCGPRLACDAARAGFGRELCALGKKDVAGLKAWKERLLHEIHTNESKHFSRRNKNFSIPDDFPNREVLGYYTHPCVSTPEKLGRLRRELKWDQSIDFAALRTFTADAFDWRCLGGAKKFLRNLAPALLVREVRLVGSVDEQLDQEEQEGKEKQYVQVIHSKRNHSTTDGELEYRISFTPANLVPIDLSIEDEDDEFIPAGGVVEDQSDAESDALMPPSSTQDLETESDAPASPSKKRNFRPYNPDQPEKLWMLRPFLQIGCPLLVEDYEAAQKDPRAVLKQRRNARATAKGDANIHATKPKAKKAKAKESSMPENALMVYAKVTKAAKRSNELAQKSMLPRSAPKEDAGLDDAEFAAVASFKLPCTQIPAELMRPKTSQQPVSQTIEVLDLAGSSPQNGKSKITNISNPFRPFAGFTKPKQKPGVPSTARQDEARKTPKKRNKKRPSPDLSSPAMSQRTITSFYSPSPSKPKPTNDTRETVISLLSSSPAHTQDEQRPPRPLTPTPPNTRFRFVRASGSPPPAKPDFSPGKLPDTVTKRRKKTPLKRWQTEPALGYDWDKNQSLSPLPTPTSREATPEVQGFLNSRWGDGPTEALEITSSSPAKSEGGLASPSACIRLSHGLEENAGGFIREEDDPDATPKAIRKTVPLGLSSPPASPSLDADRVEVWLSSGDGVDTRPTRDDEPPCSSYSTPPSGGDEADIFPAEQPTTVAQKTKKQPAMAAPAAKPSRQSPHRQQKAPPSQGLRRSPRQQVKKKRIQLRESLEGAWKEIDAEMIDMTGDGSGWKKTAGRAKMTGWRKSGVEVLDLTGA
ncbi:hypothetical protein LTR37_016535 [Vermiconidia calcicola]|uniref:Uncharacterized protein n=1 Tax=Vermiconidia calcicola TaxID=1690605 RepID=A0ACC3MP77_9PEZI|nr:hypothetical protein LTR37_016535 [Vermiconidia calcicola]